jgi:iron-sulfur cluster assembly accessory protein
MIAITPTAQDKLTEILDAQATTDHQVRVSVVRGPHGCVHGWRLGIEHEPRPDDVTYTIEGLRVVVEPDLTDTLANATIDYREDDVAVGFIIDTADSPDHQQQQGCGHHDHP